MLTQIGDGGWVDPMRVVLVRRLDPKEISEGGDFAVAIHVDGLSVPIGTAWPIEKVLEQLNGRTK